MVTWKVFTQTTTMHGIRNIHVEKIHIARRLIWLLLIMVAVGYFFVAAYIFMRDYTRRKISTKIRVEKATQLQFPTVTICNQNLWSYSLVKSSGTVALQTVLNDLYGNDDITEDVIAKYNWSDPLYSPVAEMTAEDTEYYLRIAAIPLEQSIVGCHIFGVQTNCSEVFTVVKTDGGFCFQFNSDGKLNATSAGKTGGISIMLNAVVDDYFTGPRSYSEGFSLTFHEPKEAPLVTELSVGVSPGNQAAIVLQKSEIIREPPPADENRSNCVDTDSVPNSLHYYESYSYSGCMVECKTEYIIRKCGCTDPFQPALNGTKICTFPEMLNCSANAFKAFPSDTEGLTKCDCHDPCVDYEYNVQVSNFRFPSTNFIRQADMPDEQVKWMRDNVVLLDIFYGKMSYHRLEEDLAYNVLDMIANLGGTLGLCIGGSALTLCEFAEYAILAVCRCCGCKDKDDRGNNSRVSSVIKVAPADETRDTG